MIFQHFDFKDKTREELLELIKAYQLAINANIISSITDVKGNIVHVNDKFCEVSQYEREELLGKNHNIINSNFHPKSFFDEMWKKISAGEVWQDEIKNRDKSGDFYWVDTIILPIKDKKGAITQFLSLRTLITEKKKEQEIKSEYAKELRMMLHMTSHRVRKPLVNCLAIMHLINSHDEDLNHDDLKTVVNHLKPNAIELDAFTKELTDFMYQLEQKYEPTLWKD